MSEIKPQCPTCDLFDVCDLPKSYKVDLEIRAARMALGGGEEFPQCKHPWRMMNALWESELTEDQVVVLNGLAIARGKDPQASGIPGVEEVISTLDT